MIPAVIYARYSSYNQTERSIEGQISDCLSYAERKGYTVIAQYIDRARSGTEADHRTDFLRMIKDSAHHDFQIVIVWKMDRFSRNRYDFAVYKSQLRKNGVTVESANEPISQDPSGILLDSLIEGMAEYYSQNLSQNVKRGLRVARNRGTYTGGILPLGYRTNENHKIVLDEREAPIMREIFRKYASGARLRDLVADLNRSGLHPRIGKSFTINSLEHALSNPKYVGSCEISGESYPDLYPRLIDDDTFQAVQSRKTAAKHAPAASRAYEYLLQGKAYCGHCGAPMVGDSGRSKTGSVYHYYSCSAKKKSHTCKKRSERADDLETDVIMQTVAHFSDPKVVRDCAEGLRAEYEKAFPVSDIKTLEATITRLDREIDNCMTLMISGTISPSLISRMNEKAEALQAQKEDAERDLSILRIQTRRSYSIDDYIALIHDMTTGDPSDPDFRRRIVRTFINSIFIFDDDFLVYYNLDSADPIPFDKALNDHCALHEKSSDFLCFAPPKNKKSENIRCIADMIFGFLFSKNRTK